MSFGIHKKNIMNSNYKRISKRLERPASISDDYLSNIVRWCERGEYNNFLPFLNETEAEYVYEVLMYDVVAPIPMQLIRKFRTRYQ